MTEADLWRIVETTRRRFISAGFARVRETHFVLDPRMTSWARGGRTVASCAASGKDVQMSPAMLSFDENRVTALVAHELGHAVQGFYGDTYSDPDAIERDADSIGEQVLGAPISYALVERRLMQTLSAGQRPRPKGLR